MRMQAVVPPQWDGRPLRSVLRGVFQLSTGQYKRAKFEGRILLRGVPARVSEIAFAGDEISVEWPERALPNEVLCRREAAAGLPAEALRVCYEDEHLLAADKPAPMPSVASPHQSGVTVEELVLRHLGNPAGFVYRPVNRLDKGTSGLMLIAKTAWAQQRMQSLLHTEAFAREYLAVTEGVPSPEAGEIDLPIGKAEGASIRRVILPESEGGRACRTRYTVETTGGGRALVRLRLLTGRTHQIRVHLSAIGTPICGDFLYGSELDALPGRFALHSASLCFTHPLTGERVALQSGLPPELSALMK